MSIPPVVKCFAGFYFVHRNYQLGGLEGTLQIVRAAVSRVTVSTFLCIGRIVAIQCRNVRAVLFCWLRR